MNALLTKVTTFLSGKKTYITVIVGLGLGVAQYFGYSIPEWVWTGLSALGLASVRSAIGKIQSDSSALATDVAGQVAPK
jgi:hypothetical protein